MIKLLQTPCNISILNGNKPISSCNLTADFMLEKRKTAVSTSRFKKASRIHDGGLIPKTRRRLKINRKTNLLMHLAIILVSKMGNSYDLERS